MAITSRSYTVTVGIEQQLELAQGEDRRYVFTFKEPGASAGKNMLGLQAAVLTVKDAAGILLFARAYNSDASTPQSGILAFDVAQADTATKSIQSYEADVTWTDSGGLKEQLLTKSRFLVLKGVGQAGDPVTSPPSIPVVYGLRWRDSWSSPSGGYLVNDAVQVQDGSLGATSISTLRSIASGATYYPINQSLLTPATGWAYVAQHGGSPTRVTVVATGASAAALGGSVGGAGGPTGLTQLGWWPMVNASGMTVMLPYWQ